MELIGPKHTVYCCKVWGQYIFLQFYSASYVLYSNDVFRCMKLINGRLYKDLNNIKKVYINKKLFFFSKNPEKKFI